MIMMNIFLSNMYTSEKNIQILISLMKSHGVKDIIISPGSMNLTLAASVQNDPDFNVYSCVDERSAAYMACGISAEKGSPVAISCTGATASRDYMPGLTEAFYRKLPILAITSLSTRQNVGQLMGQQLDRSQHPKDLVVESVYLPIIKDEKDRVVCEREANKALLALTLNGGGPVHIDLGSTIGSVNVETLPPVRTIKRYSNHDHLPKISAKRVAIMMGAHHVMKQDLIEAIDRFCSSYDGIVFNCNPSSYTGKFAAPVSLLFSQLGYDGELNKPELCIHIGEVNTDAVGFHIFPKEVWRVNIDGAVKDRYDKLTAIFQMSELEFFNHYANENVSNNSQLKEFEIADAKLRASIPELPYSNVWIAQNIAQIIPENSKLHLGIVNSLRVFDYALHKPKLITYANTGGYGIDGCLSSLIGASIASPDTEFYGIIGDLVLFYDLNVLGNRHVGKNIHLIVINNDGGQQFRNFDHPASVFGEETDAFIAAAGHNGSKSQELIKNFAQNLGFKYLSARNKEEFKEAIPHFIKVGESVIFECYTNKNEENDAIKAIRSIIPAKKTIKSVAKDLLGQETINTLKKILNH